MKANIEQAYRIAQERYGEAGRGHRSSMKKLAPFRFRCTAGRATTWAASRRRRALSGGGIQATGNYPGKARTVGELRAEIETGARADSRQAPAEPARLLSGQRRQVRRTRRNRAAAFPRLDRLGQTNGLGLDFNPTYFSHPKAADGFTLSHADGPSASSWIEHGIACRRIGAEMGRQLGTPTVTNVWIPDGYKDMPMDRTGPRERLADSLDQIFAEPSIRASLWTRWKPSCSALAPRAIRPARSSSTWDTPSRARSC